MPFGLNPEQIAYRSEVAARMSVARLKLSAANREAAALAADVAQAARAEIAAHPPRWRASKAGRAAQAWADRWAAFQPDPHAIDAAPAFLALPVDADQ